MSQFSRAERLVDISNALLRSFVPLMALELTACRWSDDLLIVHDGDGRTGSAGAEAGSGVGGGAGGAAGAVAGAACTGSVCSNYVSVDAGVGLTEGLVAWYRCESATDTSEPLLPDSTTHGNDGALVTGAAGAPGYGFAAGKIGDALDLSFTSQGYVMLPAGLLANACEATVAVWVYINSNANAWTRIWDFGQDTTKYMFLTPITNTDNLARFGISVCGNAQEEVIQGQAAIATLTWTHVAVVLGPSGGTLYVDGAPVGTNASMTLRPADLGSTPYNYIGRSQFSDDPYLDADIDEFRVYDRALSPEEIQALASGA